MNQYTLNANQTDELLRKQAEAMRSDAAILNSIADHLNDVMVTVSHIAGEACGLNDDQMRVYEDVIDEPLRMLTRKIQQFHREAAQKEAAASALEKDYTAIS